MPESFINAPFSSTSNTVVNPTFNVLSYTVNYGSIGGMYTSEPLLLGIANHIDLTGIAAGELNLDGISISGMTAEMLAAYNVITNVQEPRSYGSKINEWANAFVSIGWSGNIIPALIGNMIYECGLNHKLYNKAEFNQTSINGSKPNPKAAGWNCGEGTVGFTFWTTKQKLISMYNADPRSTQKLPTSWDAYQAGPHIIDVSLKDAAIMTDIWYTKMTPAMNNIRQSGGNDFSTMVAEFFIDKAGRGFATGSTSAEKAFNAAKHYDKYSGGAGNMFLRTLKTAVMVHQYLST